MAYTDTNSTRTECRAVQPQASLTTTQTTDAPAAVAAQVTPVLRLRGAAPSAVVTTRRIQWDESVVDNEGLGRKSSKVCCIYHAPRAFGESSDESSSSSSEESSADEDIAAKKATTARRGCRHGKHTAGAEGGEKSTMARRRSPNAYEKMPKIRNHGGGAGTSC
ncbi:hypothetical protein K3495_g10433 [Podosphaera aphanis]|nr:hypothetical protein K3495_g10433 [Podosphaera aphanis]